MLVKAKWSVKDGAGWHDAGDIFATESDLGDAVEVLDNPVPIAQSEEKPEEEKKEPAKKTPARRKKAGD